MVLYFVMQSPAAIQHTPGRSAARRQVAAAAARFREIFDVSGSAIWGQEPQVLMNSGRHMKGQGLGDAGLALQRHGYGRLVRPIR